ncbi:hypothetical protein RJ639_010248 [Escallonia herrerae]|uniref:Retrotransposon Copia-like N-terminal domain-containing protein n=1 Tax=Escallonia herrerae TaxID=1293975 RepID=A0AA88VQG4_9ASTE|nr:hypothetical protein RJ639_010248 [Escallonia herrerae]
MAEANANQINEGLVPIVAAYQNATIDPKSPFCLSASDHTGLLFITNPLKENGKIYFTWHRNMLNALAEKNKTDFVNGRIKKLDVIPGISNHGCNAVQLCCHGSRTRSIKNYKMEQHMRKPSMKSEPIYKNCSHKDWRQGFQNELQTLNPVPICTCGCTCGAAKKMQSMREEEKVFDFLMGLDESFGTVRSQVLSIDPLPTLGRAYAIMAQEEKQRSVTADRSPLLESTACSHTETQHLANAAMAAR